MAAPEKVPIKPDDQVLDYCRYLEEKAQMHEQRRDTPASV